MTKQEEIQAIQAEGQYDHVYYVNGKGYCGIHRYLFTYGLAVDIKQDGGCYMHDHRYCYPLQSTQVLAVCLLAWSLSVDDVEGDPPDECWVKRKGNGGEYRNPKTAHEHIN
jgi:hypothetical protein